MPQDLNLQNEINQIIDTSVDSNSSTQAPSNLENQQINPQSVNPTPYQQTQSLQQSANTVPPRVQKITQPPSYEETLNQTQVQATTSFENANSDQTEISFFSVVQGFVQKYVIQIAVFMVILLIILAVFLASSKFGPISFSDCIKMEESTVVQLEPAYCVTPDGDVFFKNRSEKIPVGENQESESPDTFDPNNPPATILPEI